MREITITLKELRDVDIRAGVPDPDMTDEEWQKYFAAMKLKITQSNDKLMRINRGRTIINGYAIADNEKDIEPQWVRYRSGINDILRVIRGKAIDWSLKTDYCYHIYQIADLLRYEHDRLRTRYDQNGRYFEVWLED